jgi:hypothetical protein
LNRLERIGIIHKNVVCTRPMLPYFFFGSIGSFADSVKAGL